MAAPKKNKNAEKWTKQTVTKALTEIEDYVIAEKSVYLAAALVHFQYYPQIWSEWRDKFEHDKFVSELIKRLDARIESNLVTRLLNNQCNAAGAIFILKNRHRMADKQEVDHTSKGESISINVTKTYKNGGKENI